jgi:hypothetical protein
MCCFESALPYFHEGLGIQKGENIPRAAMYFAVKEYSYARRHDLQTAAILNQASAVFQSKASLFL